MRILVAPDKFKGSLTAREAAGAICAGVVSVRRDVDFETVWLADGGEGTVEVILSLAGAERQVVRCVDALGREVEAEFAWLPSERLAVVEMSAASGLWRVEASERDIFRASSRGAGQLVQRAIDLGAQTIAVGLGGSATNDGGAGFASALGWRFLDGGGREVEPVPQNFFSIHEVVPGPVLGARILALCDVKNPLLGERGCSRVYGPQKGAGVGEVGRLDGLLTHLANVCEARIGRRVRDVEGAGAAGGMGFGLMAFCGGEVVSGFDWIAGRLDLRAHVAAADVVLTGEGSIDQQTLEGKGPAALALLSRELGKPCVAFGGRVEPGAGRLFTNCIEIRDPAIGLAENMARASELLTAAAAKAAPFL